MVPSSNNLMLVVKSDSIFENFDIISLKRSLRTLEGLNEYIIFKIYSVLDSLITPSIKQTTLH